MGTMNVVPIQCVKKQVKTGPKGQIGGRNERNYIGGRFRNQTVSPDKSNLEADHAGV